MTRKPFYSRLEEFTYIFGKPTSDPLTDGDKKKNFLLGVINGIFFFTSEAMLDPSLVLSTFVDQLSHSSILVGLITPIREGLWAFPQLLMSGWMQNQPHKLTYYRITSIMRGLAWGLLAFAILTITDPTWLLISFFVFYALAALINGLGGLPFMEVVGKTIDSKRWGEFFAWRMGIGGLCGVAVSFLVKYLLGNETPFLFPKNYGVLALSLFILTTIGLMIFNFIKEPVSSQVLPVENVLNQLKKAYQLVKKNKNFRYFILMQSSLIWSSAAIPFYVIFVQNQFSIDLSFVGIYLLVTTITSLLTNIILGKTSKKSGYKKVIFFSICSGLGAAVGMLIISITGRINHFDALSAALLMIPIYVLVSIRKIAGGIGLDSLLLAIAPEQERSLYLGFSNTIMGFVLLSNALGGLMMQVLGFDFLLITVILFAISSLFFLLRIAIIHPTQN